MSYEVKLGAVFKKNVKHFKKHFPNVADDVKSVIKRLQEDPHLGDVVPGQKGVRKIRVDNSDMNKGKSGSYRLLYFVIDRPTETLYILMLYAKNQRDKIPTNEVLGVLREEGLL